MKSFDWQIYLYVYKIELRWNYTKILGSTNSTENGYAVINTNTTTTTSVSKIKKKKSVVKLT